MGIPLYFRYLVNNYDNIISNNKKILEIDNLFLDLNCAIHYCCREVLDTVEYKVHKRLQIEDKFISNIMNYIELLNEYCKTKKMLFIAIDGPAPVAKMVQQRQRRFKKFYEQRRLNEIKKETNYDDSNDNKEIWDTNAITPGTEFMDRLSKRLKSEIVKSKKLKHLKIVISDSNIQGEGEHKLLNYIKSNKELYSESNVIYGLDADLIMLCLVSRLPKIYLLRETVEFDNRIHIKGYKFLYLDINKLKENLLFEIQDMIDRKHLSNEEQNKLLDDYIFLCFILGNDFIPHSPSVSIKHEGINLIIDLYSRYLDQLKCNLVDTETKKINHDFLTYIMRDLGMMEDSLLKDFSNKRLKRRKPNKIYDNEYERKKVLLNMFPQFNRIKEDKIKQGDEGWRERYYYELFHIEDRYEIDKICHNYIEGLYWNFHYYFYGCISWEWCYPYSNPPTFNDIYNYLNRFVSDINKIDIPKGRACKPFEQLLMVLPQQSKSLLPREVGNLMTDIESDIIEYFPNEYEIECVNKYYLYECPPVLPRIIINDVRDALKSCKISLQEKERNKFGKLFIKS